jgi:hypothetical protein
MAPVTSFSCIFWMTQVVIQVPSSHPGLWDRGNLPVLLSTSTFTQVTSSSQLTQRTDMSRDRLATGCLYAYLGEDRTSWDKQWKRKEHQVPPTGWSCRFNEHQEAKSENLFFREDLMLLHGRLRAHSSNVWLNCCLDSRLAVSSLWDRILLTFSFHGPGTILLPFLFPDWVGGWLVALIYYPSYLQVGALEVWDSSPTPAKTCETTSQQGHRSGVYTCNPSCQEFTDRRIMVWGWQCVWWQDTMWKNKC